MKSSILPVLILTSLTTLGQTFLGVKGGINLTNISFTALDEAKNSRSGVSGGLTYEQFMKDNFSIGADLIYNQRGFTDEIIFTNSQGNPTGQKAKTEFNYNYLSLPIKAGIYANNSKRLSLNIGFVPSYLIKAESIFPAYELDGQIYGGQTINATDGLSRLDFAGLLEFGFNFQLKDNYWLYGTISYQHGLTSFTNEDYSDDRKLKHYGLILSLGFRYRLSDGEVTK